MDKRQQKIDSFIYPEYNAEDYVLGAARSAPFEVINESGDWRPYLPEPETQKKRIESSGCTNYGSLNLLEILENYLYQEKNNYSERFQAVMSNQNRNGNDPHKVLESIRNDGVIDDALLPFTNEMTWEEYMSPQPMVLSLKIKGQQWLNKYILKHEYIYRDTISIDEKKELLKQALKRSPVGVSVYAWLEQDGVYIKPEGARDTHWCVLVAIEDGTPIIYDSYAPFLKKLSWEHFDVAKGMYLAKNDGAVTPWPVDLLGRFFRFLSDIIKTLWR